MAVVVRDAKLGDVWQLMSLIYDFKQHLLELGMKTVNKNPEVLRSGIAIEVGMSFQQDNWKYVVAERDGTLIGFLIGTVEVCAPTDEYESCLRIRGDYLRESSLANPKILARMWERMMAWATKRGIGYVYGMIHPSNQPSIRVAKSVGFKHHTTQFMKLVTESGG